MSEQFNFDIKLIFAILNGKVSAAINRKLYRNFRQYNVEITPEQWTVLLYLWEKDGVTQQELCNATFKDKPSMTRLIDNMERQNLVVRIASKTSIISTSGVILSSGFSSISKSSISFSTPYYVFV